MAVQQAAKQKELEETALEQAAKQKALEAAIQQQITKGSTVENEVDKVKTDPPKEQDNLRKSGPPPLPPQGIFTHNKENEKKEDSKSSHPNTEPGPATINRNLFNK